MLAYEWTCTEPPGDFVSRYLTPKLQKIAESRFFNLSPPPPTLPFIFYCRVNYKFAISSAHTGQWGTGTTLRHVWKMLTVVKNQILRCNNSAEGRESAGGVWAATNLGRAAEVWDRHRAQLTEGNLLPLTKLLTQFTFSKYFSPHPRKSLVGNFWNFFGSDLQAHK